jgi:hypothetical protein
LTPYANELEQVLYDCGGPMRVAEALGISRASLCKWVERGHLPFSDIKGQTSYGETLARMQRRGRLTPTDIRRIGLRL